VKEFAMATTESATPASAWYGSWFCYSPISLFAAGFISVLAFQMGALAILNAVGFTPTTPFPTSRTWPLGVPQIWSLAFWGGVWGIIYGFFEKSFPEKFYAYWVVAILFGAILPTAVLWFVVFPLKGQPMAAGWDQIRMTTHIIIHGAWGLGTALLLRYRP
jgi:hypothetical protein